MSKVISSAPAGPVTKGKSIGQNVKSSLTRVQRVPKTVGTGTVNK